MSFQPSSPGSGARTAPSRRARLRTWTLNPPNVTLCETVPSCVIRQICVPSPSSGAAASAAGERYSVAGSTAEYGTAVRTPLAESGASTPSAAVSRPYAGSKRSLTILPCTGSVRR